MENVDKKEQIGKKLTEVALHLEKLGNKDFNLYFFTFDTKGNPNASVANIYEHVKTLNKLGYKAHILHEKNDYLLRGNVDENGVLDWLGEEYDGLPHVSIEAQNLQISPIDIIVIPEVFSTIMEQIKTFPCKKVVFSQSYEYIFESLAIGRRWDLDFGFTDVITTSEQQANYVKSMFKSMKTQVVPVAIPDYFKKSDLPKTPVVTILTRNQGEAAKIAKAFYLQYPMYKWITFKELRGLSRRDFAKELGQACLGVWIDDIAGFGTFPLEAIECETPIIAKIPNMIPSTIASFDAEGKFNYKNTGLWTNTTVNIPELISTYIKIWLEDAIPTNLIEAIEADKGKYTIEKQAEVIEQVYGNLVTDRTNELLAVIETLKTNLAEVQ